MVEALLARLPMISTRVPGTEDILDNKHLVDSGDIAGLHELIKTYSHDSSILNDEMQSLFDWAESNLTLDEMVRNTHKIYQDILK